MNSYGGLLYGLYDRKHSERIKKCIDAEEPFTIPISDADFSPAKFETCLLSFDRKRLTHFFLLKRGRRVATAQRRLELEDLVSLGNIPFGRFSELHFTTVRSFLSRVERGTSARAECFALSARYLGLGSFLAPLQAGLYPGLWPLRYLRQGFCF